MGLLRLFSWLALLATVPIATGAANPASPTPAGPSLIAAYGNLPLSFEANVGQVDPSVKFISRGPGYTLFLTATKVAVNLRSGPRPDHRLFVDRAEKTPTLSNSVVIQMNLVGASQETPVRGLDELPGKANYFIGNDPAKWHTNVATYGKVKYEGIYPGVDLVYYGNQRQLEYDFVVSPGADPNAILLKFDGVLPEIDSAGDLVLHTDEGDVHFRRPLAYQSVREEERNGTSNRRLVESRFVLRGNNKVAFEVAPYDHSRPLVIDPVLVYSTYLGGSFPDEALSIAVDSSGAAYVTGITCSADFPVTTGAYDTTSHNGSGGNCPMSQNSFEDAFVTKFNAAGTALVYSTYIGGSASDRGYDIAVDSSGNAYIAGQTASTDYPTTTGAFITTCPGGVNGCNTGTVTKLNSTGSALVYSTYLGGPGNMGATGIAVNSSGQAYVTGATDESFPTTASAFQASNPKFGLNPIFAVLNASGSNLVYATFLGGTGGNFNPGSQAFGVAIDSLGKAYITGWTDSPDFPTTTGAFQTKCGTDGLCNGLWDAFVAKLDPTKSGAASLVYSTFLGGSGTDFGLGIAVDSSGNAYVTGTTGANVNTQFVGSSALPSKDFPTTAGAFQATCPGTCTTDSAWVTKLNASGSALLYSTYLGGNGNTDAGYFGSIALDSALNAYVTGFTAATDFPTQNPVQKTYGGGTADAYVTELNSNGSALVFSTYLGGSSLDEAISIALDKSADMYVTGLTSSTNFPHTAGAFQTACPGSCTYYHAFLTKIGRFNTSTLLSSSLNPSIFGQSVTFTATVKSSTTGTPTGTVTFKDGTTTLGTVALNSGIAKLTTSTLTVGTHSITAVYGGDATFLPSTSAALSQVVNSGTGRPAVSFSPTSLSFTQQLIGSTSPAKAVTLTNSGTGALTISSIVATGNFKVASTTCPLSPSTLAAGAHCAINITFTPSQSGKVLGELTVTDNVSSVTQELGLSGQGVTPLNTSPTGLSFGTVTVGTTSAAKTVTLINNSTSSLTIGFVASADYKAVGSGTTPCGASLAGKAKCTISVTFTPKSNGTINGAITISYNAAFSPVEVALSGSGTGGATSPLTFSPTSLSFASQLVGTSSPAKTVTVTNSSASSLTLGALASSGDFSAAASGTSPCSSGLVLASTHTCTFSVTFKPTVNGTITGAVWIADNSSVSPQILNVSGKGAVAVSLSPTTLNFGTITVGTVSASKTVTLTNNNQSSAVTLNGIAVSGDYKVAAGTCTGSIAAKSKCTFSVSFAPTATGTINGVVSVSYASSGSPQVVNLTGTGQ
jgi:Big-like domain-containing protein/centrosomal CEP192-like protein/beta-propeller repeat-containing protein/ASPM-SPD-2-Hydin domain-containing protein/HYDIN/CFA65/VesB family protein